MNWSGANMRCKTCNQYLPDRCTCNGPSIEQKRNAEAAAMMHNCYPNCDYAHSPCTYPACKTQPKENKMSHPATAAAYLTAYHNGETVTSISMGGQGMGGRYEKAIQETAVIFLKHMIAQELDMTASDEKLDKAWKKIQEAVDTDKDFDTGLSGAMYGAARNLAAHFYRKGPAACLTEEAVADRHITLTKAGDVTWL